MQIGTVVDSELGESYDSENPVRILNVEVLDSEDIQSVEMARIPGWDYNPPDGSSVYFDESFESGKFSLAIDDGIIPSVDKGETEIYSSADSVKKSRVHLKNDSSIDISCDNMDITINEVMTNAADTLRLIGSTLALLTADAIEIGGNTDFAVRFSVLNTQISQFIADFNKFVILYNGHVHATAAPGPPVIPSGPSAKPTSADISGAKVDTVKLP